MILSASRRTDIPQYFSEWFADRLKEGFLLIRNPFYPEKVSKIKVTPDVVDCIVFWTKNPAPMLNKLILFSQYPYYFQFTITGYGKDIELNIPDKKEVILPCFCKLSEMIGSTKMIWRYDPIFFSKKYTPAYHLRAFSEIAKALQGKTKIVVISFLDMYPGISQKMKRVGVFDLEKEQLNLFARDLAKAAHSNGMRIQTCSEKIDFDGCGIEHGSCINKQLIEQIIGSKISANKDKNQRNACGCIESIDIGAYGTCGNNCLYCYAAVGGEKENAQYYICSPLLCDVLKSEDKISERKVESLKIQQMSLFSSEE